MEETTDKNERNEFNDAVGNEPSASESVCVRDNSIDLPQKVQLLEVENCKIQKEFNMQRAKLKELFVQKEMEYSKCQKEKESLRRELDELKSQFLVADLKSENEMRFKEHKAQEEISSLQQLVQDTIEESSVCKAELERIKEESSRLWLENRELRDQGQHQETSSLGPQVLSQVKKTLARKLGGESSGHASLSSFHQESTDETVRNRNNGKQYANEDAEVLRSIVVQLQEEMKALKEKLRQTDKKLQANEKSRSSDLNVLKEDNSIHKSTSVDMVPACDNCQNNESKIEELLSTRKENLEKIDMLQKSLEESREDLQKEAALRKVLEEQWQDKREIHKTEVQLLREQVKSNEEQLLNLQQKFLETKEESLRDFHRVIDERERLNKHLETLQTVNNFLSGQYLATAEEIENQYINLPNTVEELQELILRQQNELIQARVGSEYEKQKCVSSLDEIQILRDQLEASNNEMRVYKKKMHTETKSLQNRLTEHLLTLQNNETTKTALERKEVELNRQISELRVEMIELQDTNEKLSKKNTDYRLKINNLQDDLATSEQVQKDFVKLSQTLQMSLEKLRHADTEVRWQDDEDVDSCPSCSIYFTVTVRKIHCRHCGHIYCDKCLTKTVPSGPRKRVARVCDICHTLLTPNTAPYFSHGSIQSS